MAISFGGLDIDLVSSTLQEQLPEMIDGLYRTTPFLMRCQKGGFSKTSDGGNSIVYPISTDDQSTVQTLEAPWSPLQLAFASTSNQMQYYYANAVTPIGWDNATLRQNAGRAKVIDLAQERAEEAMEHAMRALEERFVRGSVGTKVTSGISQFNTLNGNVTGGVPSGFGSTAGFLQNLAPGTTFAQTNTIGGLSRTGLPQLNNQFRSENVVVGIQDSLIALDTDCQMFRKSKKGTGFDIVLMSPNAYATYRSELVANERFVLSDKELDVVGMRGALMFGGSPVFPTPYMDLTSTDPNSIMCLDLGAIYPVFLRDGDFKMSDIMPATGYDGTYALITTHGQLVAKTLAGSGLIVLAE